MTDRVALAQWIAAYESAWRSPGVELLDALFTADATYLQSPYARPIVGLPAIRVMWGKEREGPDEAFTMNAEIVAVDGDVGVVRVRVQYGDPVRQEYRDLWLVRLRGDGRCEWFEEWPFTPEKGGWSAR
jgi:ketosteroid isomerase-like protein